MQLHNIEYKDWFINQKRIPDKSSEEYKNFFNFHKELCMNGVMLDGQYINPFLYWHLNIWHTEVDIIDEYGRINQKYANPLLRDNEWLVTNEIDRAQKEKKGLVILGIRRFAKSVLEASYIGQGATFDENSQNIIAGLNAPDIKLITDKIDKGLNFLPEAWRWQRVEDNWKNQVTLGIKTKTGERIPFSQILIRNLDEGNNEEAIAGTKPRRLIIDEIGKGSFLRGLQAATPGFTTPFGWGCSPILTGCVCAGTKVWTNKGKLVNIEDIKQKEGILGYGLDSISKEPITYLKPKAKKPCVEIFFNDGSSLKCSVDHPLLVKTSRLKTKAEFIKAENINKNTQILMPDSINIFGNKFIKDAYLVGLMIGDGYYPKYNTLSVSIDSKEVYNYITSNYNTEIRKEWVTNKGKYYDLSLKATNTIKSTLNSLGILGQVKGDKRLPENIHEFDKNSLAALLAGYYDADGNVNLGKNGRIVLTSVVIELLEEVKFQLTKFGIYSSISIEKRNSLPFVGYEGQKNYIGRLYINKLEDCKLFYNYIPIKSEHKVANLKKIINQTTVRQHGKIESIKFKYKEDFPKGGFYKDNTLSNLRYKTVIRVENIGEQYVYNLTAGKTHTYIANSLITSNTGGDMKKFMDAKSLMFDVENFNFLEYNSAKDDKRVHGLFISHKYRMEAKEQSTLGDFLKAPKESSLYDVSMMVSNEELATKITNDNLEKLKKAGDRVAYLKEKMYYPQEVDDIFLNEDSNIFDVEAAKRQKVRLLAERVPGTPVILYTTDKGITHDFTDKAAITSFPLKSTDLKDAPIIIYEFPIQNPPYGLYVAGVDSYRQGKSSYSTSLGSVYIYKRMNSINGETYQNMFVASYCARPDKKEKWDEQARLLIKYYNARTLCENDEISFIDYMISKGDQHYLERQPEWLKEIVPNTTVRRDYGIHRSSDKIRDFLHNCLKKYTEETIHIEKDNEGNITSEVKGMSKILDPVLLEEIIQYNETGNFDRIIAAELAIALAMKLDPIIGSIGGDKDERISSMFKKNKKNVLFTESRGMFNGIKNKLFT